MPHPRLTTPRRPVRRPALALAATLGAAFAVAVAPPSDAGAVVLGVQDDRLTSGPIDAVDDRMDLLRESRAKITRIDVLWSLVAPTRPANPRDPADPAYHWERTDAVMRGIARLKITPIVVAYSAPGWAAGGRGVPEGTEVNPHAPQPRHYAHFMEALAKRYSGAFTPDGGDGPLPRARHYEIWNEPNLAGFLSPQVAGGRRVAVDRYVALARAAYPAIKRVNRSAIVIAGVAGPRSSTDERGTGALLWAQRIAASRAPFDAYSQHVYPAAAPRAATRAFPAWRTLPRLFAALDAVPRRRGVPVYLTEMGYTTASTPFRNVRVTRSQQAAHLRQIMGMPAVRGGRVRALIWFNLQDNPNWPGGLIDLHGRKKPAFGAFVPVARAEKLTADLRVTPPITLSRRQLLINQRISQAAVRRGNGLTTRFDAGLTGGDLKDGAVDARRLAGGIGIISATPAPNPPPATVTRVAAAGTGGGGVKLTAEQLGINQRIAQAGVRRANALAARLAGGLITTDFRPGSLTAVDLDPGLRGGPTAG